MRRFPIYIGIAGLVTLIFVVAIMLQVIRKSDFAAKSASDETDQSTPAAPEKTTSPKQVTACLSPSFLT